MQAKYYLGIMSGTSLDGVDLALLDFAAPSQPRIVATALYPMPLDLQQQLTALITHGSTTLDQLGMLDHRLGHLYADSVLDFLHQNALVPSQIAAIGCHGQTVWHAPNAPFPFTMQIGDMNIVAAKTGITTIADFRRKDLALGGQGAPLVPAFHHAVFAADHRITAVLNIGGISNVSLLRPNQPVIGYDIGPGNTLMDTWIWQHKKQRFDANGDWARTGHCSAPLLAQLLADPYFSQSAPKSTGREYFNPEWLHRHLQPFPMLSAQDVQATLLELTAQSIAQDLQQWQQRDFTQYLSVCGGGAHNAALMERLSDLLPTWQVGTTRQFGLDPDYIEAAAFAWLAYCRQHHIPSNLPSVTGAKSAVSLGVIYPA